MSRLLLTLITASLFCLSPFSVANSKTQGRLLEEGFRENSCCYKHAFSGRLLQYTANRNTATQPNSPTPGQSGKSAKIKIQPPNQKEKLQAGR